MQAEADHHRSRLASLRAAAARRRPWPRARAPRSSRLCASCTRPRLGAPKPRRASGCARRSAPAHRLRAAARADVKSASAVGQVDTEGAYKSPPASTSSTSAAQPRPGGHRAVRRQASTACASAASSRRWPTAASASSSPSTAPCPRRPPRPDLDLEVTLGHRPALVLPNGPVRRDHRGQWVFVVSRTAAAPSAAASPPGAATAGIEVLTGCVPASGCSHHPTRLASQTASSCVKDRP